MRKKVLFGQTQVRVFLIDDEPIASEPPKNICISLKESFGVAHLPGFYLGNNTRPAQDSFQSEYRDLMLDRMAKVDEANPKHKKIIPQTLLLKPSSGNRLPQQTQQMQPQIKYSIYNLIRVACEKEGLSEGCKREIKTQTNRQLHKFQIVYHKELLIPTDPLQSPCHSEVSTEAGTRRLDLFESSQLWQTYLIDIQKHVQIATELNEMLGKGLFSCAGDMVFKVIQSLNLQHLERSSQLNLNNQLVVQGLTSNLIQIWNVQIQHQEFQYLPEELRRAMILLNNEHSQKPAREFGAELLKFYKENATVLIEVENKKKQIQQILQALPRNRNYRTLPCKMYHGTNGTFCNKGDQCNFIHCVQFKNKEIPRDYLYQLRAENVQKYSQMLLQTQQQLTALLPPGAVMPPELQIQLQQSQGFAQQQAQFLQMQHMQQMQLHAVRYQQQTWINQQHQIQQQMLGNAVPNQQMMSQNQIDINVPGQTEEAGLKQFNFDQKIQ